MCASASTGYGGGLDFHLVDRESRMPFEVEGKLALNWRPVTGQKWESKLENCSPNFPALVSFSDCDLFQADFSKSFLSVDALFTLEW